MNDFTTLNLNPDMDINRLNINFSNQVTVITGGAKGIGLAIACSFAAHSSNLVLLDISAENLAKAKTQITGLYPDIKIETITLDITQEDLVTQAFEEIKNEFGHIDILINNAGISMNKASISLSSSEWLRAMDINVNAAFYCCQQAAKQMLEQKSGVILNMSSMYGVVAAPNRAAYCTSKAAIAMLTKVLAIEWASQGLRVNAVAPGYVVTDLVQELVKEGRMDLERLKERTPAKRLGTLEDIAKLSVFLASDQASFINGQIITADGGWSAYSYI